MKIGSSFYMAVAVLSGLALTTGCVTTESQGSGRGAGAKHRGVYKADHKGKETPAALTKDEWETEYGTEADEPLYQEEVSSSDMDYTGEPSQSASAYGETEIYIVQKGDVLSQLAVDFDTTTASLVDMNGLSNPDVLYVGQELSVPAGRGASKTTTKPTGTIQAGGTYTIQKGDTLSEIALAAGVTIDDLRELNGINGDNIMAGEELKIPSYGSVPAAKKTTTKKAEPAPEVEPAAEPVMTEPAAAPMAAAPAAVAPVEVDMVVDEVMYPGETLDDKARQYGVTKAEIMRLNGITDESQVREGQTIRIPVAE